MNAFESMVGQLCHFSGDGAQKMKRKVSREEYDIFCKEFIFDVLREETFGEAFCKKFNVVDHNLMKLSDETAKFIIEQTGYLENEEEIYRLLHGNG